MDFFPIFIRLERSQCLVVGGGEIAARKVALLSKTATRIHVVAPAACAEIQAWHAQNLLQYHQREYARTDLDGKSLVIAATDQDHVNQIVAQQAQELGLWVNVVDNPHLGNFIMPAILDRTPMVIALSSGGAAPVLARQLRARLETIIPASYGRLATIAQEFRAQVKQRLHPTQRRRFWEQIFQGPVAERVLSGQEEQARALLRTTLEQDPVSTHGEVYLVGAGPGNPDLLTFMALRLMQQADVIVYDRLVAPAILELARRDAHRIYVGKEREHHTLRQDEINQLLIKLAREGKRVCRLKGGDPFIFGRGGEEIATLAAEGIAFQIVPGITAASGCAAYAGIPLTHRDHAQSCVFVTGHLRDGSLDLNWPALAQPQQTIVFYMGLLGLPLICQNLIQHGLPDTTPIALVQQGTTPQQRVLLGTLASMPAQIEQNQDIKPPTLIIVGTVVNLHHQLSLGVRGGNAGYLG